MIVMMIAITPSLNACNRPGPISARLQFPAPGGQHAACELQ
jgi:hypothetical protein